MPRAGKGANSMERVVANLNRALHSMMESDPSVYLIGEDLLDPYGGAFKVSRGLSSAFPERVVSTPISEGGLLGVANGLVLSGQKVFAELMFGDFTFLAMDQIVNFAAKSVSMYGERMVFPLIVRCPVGGRRGYGATHSQTIAKHFIGVPNLPLYELSPVHESSVMMPQIFQRGEPAVIFENKILYAHRHYDSDQIDDLYRRRNLDESGQVVILESGEKPEAILIAGGGMVPSCLEAGRRLLLEAEIAVDIVVPYQLYPFPVTTLASVLEAKPLLAIVEEGTAGGTWGSDVAAGLYAEYWSQFRSQILNIHSKDSIIPSARHLEDQMLVSPDNIVSAIAEAL